MKIQLKILMFLLALSQILLACTSGAGRAELVQSKKPRLSNPQPAPVDLQALASSNTAFAFDLYQALKDNPGNQFYSPYSISLALAMTYAGASGTTASQMAQALHFTLPPQSLHTAFNALSLDLAARKDQASEEVKTPFELSIANSLWGQRGETFQPAFLDLLAQNYGAGLRLLDFSADPERARQAINQWVSQQTQDKIKDILPPGTIDALTRLVLANAIYFKASWWFPFTEGITQPAPFHLLDGSTVQVDMMHKQTGFEYAETEDYQMVELPYNSGNISMLVILPRPGKFQQVEANLAPGILADFAANEQRYPVELSLPKFTFESQFNLNAALAGLGMTDAFDPAQADFSAMTGKRELYIGNILHKAFVAVDEAGTEAAAATIVIMPVSALPEKVIEFKADRPFIFLIRDRQSGSLLFVGRLVQP